MISSVGQNDPNFGSVYDKCGEHRAAVKRQGHRDEPPEKQQHPTETGERGRLNMIR